MSTELLGDLYGMKIISNTDVPTSAWWTCYPPYKGTSDGFDYCWVPVAPNQWDYTTDNTTNPSMYQRCLEDGHRFDDNKCKWCGFVR